MYVLLETRPLTRARAARLLGVSEEFAVYLLVFLAAMHDIGKFSPAFQACAVPDGWSWPARLAPATNARKSRHTEDGLILWDEDLQERFVDEVWPRGLSAISTLAPAIFGHHGRPVRNTDQSAVVQAVFCGGSRAIADAWLTTLLQLWPRAQAPSAPPRIRNVKIASWWVAGLLTLADWVGSDTHWFPYTNPDPEDLRFEKYWKSACERARDAVHASGLVPPVVSPRRDYSGLARLDHPTPLQLAVESVDTGTGPVLAIVEDATGAGKTEAAQMLVHRLMVEGRASGAFWAMPTQATANAMYKRQADMLAALFASDSGVRPSLVLAHGRARLHQAFMDSVLSEYPLPATSIAERVDDDLPSEVACPAFMADDGRKALLADIGVGTVDQAFLAVLPTRYNALRLFALSEKVLVLDEVHAFDEYMRAEALALLRFHASLGGSAVLLSATLPTSQRQRLIEVWHAASRAIQDDTFASTHEGISVPYPLLTVVHDGPVQLIEQHCASPSWTVRKVPVRWLRRADEALDVIVRATGEGACAVWIRNTVGACLEAAAQCRARGVPPIVFHARFTPVDRQRIEAEVMQRFGPRSTREERAGMVLIATQVVEQSLDIDFDVMVSDLAPVDLLIQRAGRLWRHVRAADARPFGCERVIHVLSGPTDREPEATWVSAVLPKTDFVYRDAGVLWRTAHRLDRAGALDAPDGLRGLIESVYEEDDVPQALVAASDKAKGQAYANAAVGFQYVINPLTGYGGDAISWSSDVTYQTRLGDPTVTIRLARVTPDGSLTPWCEERGETVWRSWVMSEVRLRVSQLKGATEVLPEWRIAAERVRAGWAPYERTTPIVPMKPSVGGGYEGGLVRPGGGAILRLSYDEVGGLALG